ncbi:MAG: hypothetical protein ACRD2F_08285 [Terriglobales bacterium]
MSRVTTRLFLAAAACAALVVGAAAQTPGRYTLGVQFVDLVTLQPLGYSFVESNSSQPGRGPQIFYSGIGCQCGYPGFGLRFTARLTGSLGLDAELDFLPRQGPSGERAGFTELLAGPRLRLISRRRFGVFVYFRPGLLSLYSEEVAPSGASSFSPLFPGPDDDFVFNLGGSIEFSVSRHWLARLDVGDLWITGSGCNDCVFSANGSGLPTNNLQASLGFAYRF